MMCVADMNLSVSIWLQTLYITHMHMPILYKYLKMQDELLSKINLGVLNFFLTVGPFQICFLPATCLLYPLVLSCTPTLIMELSLVYQWNFLVANRGPYDPQLWNAIPYNSDCFPFFFPLLSSLPLNLLPSLSCSSLLYLSFLTL